MSALSDKIYRKLRRKQIVHIPPSAQPLSSTVTLTLEGAKTRPEIFLTDTRRNYSWSIMMSEAGKNSWRADVQLPMKPTIVTYHFMVDKKKIVEHRLIESRDIPNMGNRPVYSEWAKVPFKIAVYDPKGMPADWTKGMTVYQIFPDRFAKSQTDEQAKSHLRGVYGHEPKFLTWDKMPELPPLGRDFFGGDLRGVIQKLDYLADLGVECIYFNPIFEASTNHRYEAINFMKIDPMLGTEADFDELIAEAHKRDIKVVLDAVFNHCSSDSIYFDIGNNYGNGAYHSIESPYYRWFKFDPHPTGYHGWWGMGFMPEFVESPEMEDYFLGEDGVTAYWLNKGIDGWRCDVAFDNTDEFWRRFRDSVNATKPEAWTISEEWRDATHYLLGDMFNATMNYRFMWATRGFFAHDQLSASEMDDRLNAWMRDTPYPALASQMNLLDSHDIDRLINACGGDKAKYRQCMAFLFAHIGAPTIFYGSETAIDGTMQEDSRRTMPWDKLDSDLIAYFKKLLHTRKDTPVLRMGDVETVWVDDKTRTYAIKRTSGKDTLYALFNGGDTEATISVKGHGTWHDLLGNVADVSGKGKISVTLGARGFAWLMKK
ncbi:MAG: glycoside hydrolase family 13 protein [bacterium]|nr:glycoside hydrolase family 13 protein [bacterium]